MDTLPKNSKSAPPSPLEGFRLFLKSQGASPVTIKNYLSDFNHFWGWLVLTLKSKLIPFDEKNPLTIISQITPQLITHYKDFLLANQTPVKTINRRLSSLRKFGQFCLAQAWLKSNPAKKVNNVVLEERIKDRKEQLLTKFEEQLKKEKASPVTIKNYLSDLRHFLGWLETAI